MLEFSVVIPIKDEADFIPLSLPSYLALNPKEVILAIDAPIPKKVKEAVDRVVERLGAENKVKVLSIPVGGWADQQIKARRLGFRKAECNRILTGDIDLIVNRNTLKAVNLVGKDDVGLVSVSKFRLPHGLLSFARLFSSTTLRLLSNIRKRFGATTFTGLYAFWKPYWEEVEPLEKAKRFQKIKVKVREKRALSLEDFFGAGGDTLLRDEMIQKHKVVYLQDIGAFVLTDPWEDRPMVQYGKGIYFAVRGRSTSVALGRAFLRIQPYYFVGHLYGKKLVRRGLVKKQFLWEWAQ